MPGPDPVGWEGLTALGDVMEAMVPNREIRQKSSVRTLLRAFFCLAVGSLAVAAVSNMGLYMNGDFLPEEVRGPHPVAGAIGATANCVGMVVIPCTMLLNLLGLPLSFFRGSLVANFLVALGGFLLSSIAWSINTDGLMRVRGNPARRHAAEVSKLGTLIDRYATKHDGQLPIPDNWCTTLTEFDPDAAGYLSYPLKENVPPGFSTLALNASLAGKRLADMSSDVVLLFGTQPTVNPVGDHQLLTAAEYRGKGAVVLFVDLHVEFVQVARFGNLRWSP